MMVVSVQVRRNKQHKQTIYWNVGVYLFYIWDNEFNDWQQNVGKQLHTAGVNIYP